LLPKFFIPNKLFIFVLDPEHRFYARCSRHDNGYHHYRSNKNQANPALMPTQPTHFTRSELARYARHLALPEFGLAAQQKLKEAKVLVIGAGGLGSPMLLYLAAAGVGKIGIVDFDVVDESNLQRQVLFGEDDLGIPKTEAAKARIKSLNPHINIVLHQTRLSSENALEIIQDYDVVADGSDNFPTRYLVNDACVLLNKPLVFGAIFQFEGQISVFNYLNKNGNKGPNYRDLHPTPPLPGTVPSCAEGGVLGVLPGIIGSMQASEVIKVITGIGEPLSGRLFHFDALDFESRIFKIKPRGDNPLTGLNPNITELIDYEDFCGIKPAASIKEISAAELKGWQANGEKIQLIDVREPAEYQLGNIGGALIPLNSIAANAHLLSKDGKVVFHCQTGVRSAKAIQELQDRFNLPNLYNLSGGIMAYWASEKI
jgi:sulfur-carrier protein adenylyltransferase/sulfurtransferase